MAETARRLALVDPAVGKIPGGDAGTRFALRVWIEQNVEEFFGGGG